MPPITPVPSTRVSDLLIRSRLLSQLQFDQKELFRIQSQVSSGRKFVLPSENAPAASRAISLQQLIERKTQVQTNLTTNQSFLAATDSALNSVSGLLGDVRASAVSVADTLATDEQRLAVATEVQRAVDQLLDTGNQVFRGRYLFAGTRASVRPFALDGNHVRYDGNEGELKSYSDIDVLFETSLHGNDVFGAISDPVLGTVDLNPVLSEDTLLSDLNGGLGVSKGSITLSDGTNTRLVDLSRAATIGDVARLIETSPPPTRTVTATVTATGLEISLDSSGGGVLSITEVGGGTTARDLGILEKAGAISGKVSGTDLNPRLRLTSKLDDVLGSRASALLSSSGANNDLVLTAATNGAQLNGVTVQYVDDDLLQAGPGLTAGDETVVYDTSARAARGSLALLGGDNDIVLTAVNAGSDFNNVSIVLTNAGDVKNSPTATYTDAGGVRQLTLGIDDSNETTLGDLITAIEATGLFTVSPDPSASEGFNNATAVLTANAGLVSGNTGNSGGDAKTLYIHVDQGDSTANDVVAAINAEGTFSAQTDPGDALSTAQEGTGPVDVNASATTAGGSGITLDKSSGIQIAQGNETFEFTFDDAETVEDLLNILNGSEAGVLAQINAKGNGINLRSRLSGADFTVGENGGATAEQLGLRSLTAETSINELNKGIGVLTRDGTDFVVVRNDGTELEIDVSGAESIGDVLDLVNGHPDNLDPATAVVARLATFGNGIELVDDNPTGLDPLGQPNTLKVRVERGSLAAVHLGLVPEGQTESTPAAAAAPPVGNADLTGPNTDLSFAANQAGTQFGGARVVIVNSAAAGDVALVSYDGPTNTLTIDVDPAATRAATVVAAVDAEGTFTASLDTSSGPNDGSGLIVDSGQIATLSDGAPESLAGRDTRPLETEGVFNTLIRLRTALEENDLLEIERTLKLLEEDLGRVNFARADIGARSQGLDVLSDRLETEQIQLKQSLSLEIDVDLAESISEMSARQLAFQASLQTSAQLLQFSLLDFL